MVSLYESHWWNTAFDIPVSKSRGIYLGLCWSVTGHFRPFQVQRGVNRMSMYFCTSVKIPQHSPTQTSGHYKPEAESYKKVLMWKGTFSVETSTSRQKSGFRTKQNFSVEKVPFNRPYFLLESGPTLYIFTFIRSAQTFMSCTGIKILMTF